MSSWQLAVGSWQGGESLGSSEERRQLAVSKGNSGRTWIIHSARERTSDRSARSTGDLVGGGSTFCQLPTANCQLFFLILLTLFLAPSPGHTQILEHEEARFFGEEPFFNEEFIARNEIREIRAPISKKREMDRIRKTGTEYRFEFDREGRLKRQYRIYVHSDSVTDTTFIDYEYDGDGQLTRIRRNDHHGFFANEYERDSLGRVVEERYLRIENEGSSRYDFQPGREFVIDEESYRYQRPSDTLLIQEYYNSKDRIYRRKFYYRDSLGYLKRVRSRYVVTNKVSETRYEYDEMGRVTQRYEDNDVSDTVQERYEYAYDSIGNLLERNHYKNDVQMRHQEYLYRDTTMLLDAEIDKEEETLLITITRFKYRFWGADPKGREEEGVRSEQ